MLGGLALTAEAEHRNTSPDMQVQSTDPIESGVLNGQVHVKLAPHVS